MPKPTKNAGGKKKGGGGKNNKPYAMPEKIPQGTILTDILKRNWLVGPSIGIGGFGEIYSACKDGESKYEYVVKCEPHENGPLFVEMHFYIRNGKEADLQSYKEKHGIKSLGMPHIMATGSLTLKGIVHRYIVIPRYGHNIEHYFMANGRRLPTGAVYRLTIQMLDVYEYIHQCGYVHGDLKAANILMGLGTNGNAQAYLVDFGLASRYFLDREYKPDPKQAHDGTIQYTSRDAHKGVTTMRSDFEILGYNLIQWLGVELPWVREKLITNHAKVHAAKMKFMDNLDSELKKLFPQDVPAPLAEFLKYVAKLEHNDRPDYTKCKKIFQDGLKTLKIPDSGDLELTIKGGAAKIQSPAAKRPIQRKRAAVEPVESDNESNDEQRNASEDDDDDVVFETKPKKRTPKPGTLKAVKVLTPTKKANIIPKKIISKSPPPRKRISPRIASAHSISPMRKKAKTTPPSSSKRAISPSTHSPLSTRKMTKTTQPSTSRRATPLSARANINFSPTITLAKKSYSSLASRNGSTTVNNNITPNPCASKTYEFNVELNVSMDADVVVNVNRKKKSAREAAANSPKQTPNGSSALNSGGTETPVTRVKVHKISSGSDVDTPSPRTPIVSLKKTKHPIRKN